MKCQQVFFKQDSSKNGVGFNRLSLQLIIKDAIGSLPLLAGPLHLSSAIVKYEFSISTTQGNTTVHSEVMGLLPLEKEMKFKKFCSQKLNTHKINK